MKTKSAVRLLCKACRFVRRRGRLFVVCSATGKHKQRRGSYTAAQEPQGQQRCSGCNQSFSSASLSAENTPDTVIPRQRRYSAPFGGVSVGDYLFHQGKAV